MTKDTDVEANSLVPSGEKIQAILDRAAKLDAKILDCTRKAYDPKNRLKRQVELGEAFVERARHQKLNTTDWSKKAYSSLASKREEEIKLVLGINEVRLDVAAKIYGFVEFIAISNPLVENVSYYRIANHFISMFTWDCKALEGSIDPEWLTFIRNVIDDNAETEDRKAMPVKKLEALIEEETKRRSENEDSRPNDKPGKELEASAKAKAVREKKAAIKARDDARDGLVDAVESFDKLSEYSDADKAKSLVAAGVVCGVELVCAQTIDVESVKSLVAAMYRSGKIAELNAIVTVGSDALAKMIEQAKAHKAA